MLDSSKAKPASIEIHNSKRVLVSKLLTTKHTFFQIFAAEIKIYLVTCPAGRQELLILFCYGVHENDTLHLKRESHDSTSVRLSKTV